MLDVVIENGKNKIRKGARLLKMKVRSAILRSTGHLQLEVQIVVIKIRTCENLR